MAMSQVSWLDLQADVVCRLGRRRRGFGKFRLVPPFAAMAC